MFNHVRELSVSLGLVRVVTVSLNLSPSLRSRTTWNSMILVRVFEEGLAKSVVAR
jgi:hypothetical protein